MVNYVYNEVNNMLEVKLFNLVYVMNLIILEQFVYVVIMVNMYFAIIKKKWLGNPRWAYKEWRNLAKSDYKRNKKRS